jgi:uncharacterized protein (DUF3084 family)
VINHQAIEEAEAEIREKQDEINYGDLDEETVQNYESDIQALEDELKTLKQEQEDYREGYDAGNDYHMGGRPMQDSWLGRFGKFREGFDAAGQDS